MHVLFIIWRLQLILNSMFYQQMHFFILIYSLNYLKILFYYLLCLHLGMIIQYHTQYLLIFLFWLCLIYFYSLNPFIFISSFLALYNQLNQHKYILIIRDYICSLSLGIHSIFLLFFLHQHYSIQSLISNNSFMVHFYLL